MRSLCLYYNKPLWEIPGVWALYISAVARRLPEGIVPAPWWLLHDPDAMTSPNPSPSLYAHAPLWDLSYP